MSDRKSPLRVSLPMGKYELQSLALHRAVYYDDKELLKELLNSEKYSPNVQVF
jgi:hypothetical protein